MDKYQVAEMIARTIHYNGWDSLSYNEKTLFKTDKEFKVLILELLSIFKRNEMLKVNGHYIYDNNITLKFHIDWEFGDGVRRALLWMNIQTSSAVLEIKQWTRSEYHGAGEAGAHQLIFQRTIEFENEDELNEKCKEILYQYEFPIEKTDEIQV